MRPDGRLRRRVRPWETKSPYQTVALAGAPGYSKAVLRPWASRAQAPSRPVSLVANCPSGPVGELEASAMNRPPPGIATSITCWVWANSSGLARRPVGHSPAHGLVQPFLGHGGDTLRVGLLLAARLVLLVVVPVGRLGPRLLRGLRPPLRRGVLLGRARRLRLTPSPREKNPRPFEGPVFHLSAMGGAFSNAPRCGTLSRHEATLSKTRVASTLVLPWFFLASVLLS